MDAEWKERGGEDGSVCASNQCVKYCRWKSSSRESHRAMLYALSFCRCCQSVSVLPSFKECGNEKVGVSFICGR